MGGWKLWFNTSAPAVAAKDTTQARCDAQGQLLVTMNGASGAAPAAAADGAANPTANSTIDFPMIFNGTTWDRLRGAIVAKTATFTGLLNVLGMGRYNAAPPTLTDGDVQLKQLDISGNARTAEQFQPVAEDNGNGVYAYVEKPINVGTYNASFYDIIAKATAGNIKATAGNLYVLYVTNTNAAAQAYALVNKATAAATGDTPVMYFQVAAGATLRLEWRFGKRFTTGIAWAQVTTIGAATITTTTSDSLVDAEFI